MKQIIKGWVVVNDNWLDEGEIFLVKNELKTVDYDNDDGRQLRILVSNALDKLGISDLHTEDDYESGISGKYIADNVSMELFASDKRMKLDQIREYIVLDSMGLLEFQENWYGYSTWTIEGFNTETFTLGGHDILEILENYKGKFVYLVIDKLQ
ncbi:hypothetical protein G15_3457 [Enterococcus avium]|nr:hypothetical protein G15_1331 [Enterococcus avium]BBM19776.1 hypothetical protein G15_3457 [Enterococcus avium]